MVLVAEAINHRYVRVAGVTYGLELLVVEVPPAATSQEFQAYIARLAAELPA